MFRGALDGRDLLGPACEELTSLFVSFKTAAAALGKRREADIGKLSIIPAQTL